MQQLQQIIIIDYITNSVYWWKIKWSKEKSYQYTHPLLVAPCHQGRRKGKSLQCSCKHSDTCWLASHIRPHLESQGKKYTGEITRQIAILNNNDKNPNKKILQKKKKIMRVRNWFLYPHCKMKMVHITLQALTFTVNLISSHHVAHRADTTESSWHVETAESTLIGRCAALINICTQTHTHRLMKNKPDLLAVKRRWLSRFNDPLLI
jgi:hypothetical protein